MARIKYYYDTETCRYERMRASIWDILINIVGFLLLSFLFAFLFLQYYAHFFDSEHEAAIREENENLKAKLENVNLKMNNVFASLDELKKKDSDIYRLIFEAEPYQEDSVVENLEFNYNLKDINTSFVLINETNRRLEVLNKHLSLQSKSYDEIIQMARNKEKMLSCLPAVRPLKNEGINNLASGFGMRIHPIYKVLKMHTGLDFSAKIGTPVHATGDGIVVIASNLAAEGYGNQIEIDHGYGFKTKYAHLSKIKTQLGAHVKRGELIGYVGNTGTSVAPHLHYEIIKNGQKVNPINYFYNDLSPNEYEKMIELSKVENQSLGGE